MSGLEMPRQNAAEQFDGAANHLNARGTSKLHVSVKFNINIKKEF